MVIMYMKYLIFLLVLMIYITVCLQDSTPLEAFYDFFFGGILGFSVAWLVSHKRR